MRAPGLRVCSIPALCLLGLLPFLRPNAAAAAETSYLTILVPGALGTFPMGINNSMTVTGYYNPLPSTAAKHQFVRIPYWTITTVDPPRGMQTSANCINDSGVIAGSFYYDWNAQTSIGYLRIDGCPELALRKGACLSATAQVEIKTS